MMIISSPIEMIPGNIYTGLQYVDKNRVRTELHSSQKFKVLREASVDEFVDYHNKEWNHSIDKSNAKLSKRFFYEISVD
jgi:hypothetical protein